MLHGNGRRGVNPDHINEVIGRPGRPAGRVPLGLARRARNRSTIQTAVPMAASTGHTLGKPTKGKKTRPTSQPTVLMRSRTSQESQ
jgi:hypothetical protein